MTLSAFAFIIIIFGDGEPSRLDRVATFATFAECEAQIDAFDWSGREASPICLEE